MKRFMGSGGVDLLRILEFRLTGCSPLVVLHKHTGHLHGSIKTEESESRAASGSEDTSLCGKVSVLFSRLSLSLTKFPFIWIGVWSSWAFCSIAKMAAKWQDLPTRPLVVPSA